MGVDDFKGAADGWLGLAMSTSSLEPSPDDPFEPQGELSGRLGCDVAKSLGELRGEYFDLY